MNVIRILSWVIGIFVLALIVVSFISSEDKSVDDVIDNFRSDSNKQDDLKDKNSIIDFNSVVDLNSIVSKTENTYSDIKNRIVYGSKNRKLPTEVYFCPEDNCEEKLITLISNSKKTIDCAVYDLTLDAVTDALITSNLERNVKVRFVSDAERSSSKYSLIGKIKDSNMSVITNSVDSSYMHNKFCVFDSKIVWVGSMNFTLNGAYKNNNNVLVIEDKEVAKEFTRKIDTFFDGEFSPQVSSEIYAKDFGNSEIYFCPEDNCLYHVEDYLEDSNVSLDCMYFSYTLDSVTEIIKNLDSKKRFIFEKRNSIGYSEYQKLEDLNIPVIVDNNPNNMHNKFCVIDNKIVMTGSLNLSVNGTENNDESLVFINDSNIAMQYTDYFNKYWQEWNS
ncbi:MAG: phospholipase D-like domain-containing protein [archaeon]|jgi:phosphatidylserine/phosphatidylglycerophosphate/cardiolipin synthase-like enzyme|nr:phospholipase D-like domain-containing protein [archaeon]MDD2477663.1 phospholipase D-like domain-containing protein [Candidatus ainarchaeum sp.]MDD3084389.1 phospholipase D-like domain-containing protein [Candidatus ainarchaeum sp.]MDD4220845.1 phospholipase D-like domain-containing protein [Candidatus ainarchaeum sp.]MDD4662345.1 phospholipase D-like domain-containing protein [Candidatus ainarchaeum sp.]